MSNERLRAAIDAAGLTIDQLADLVEVDAKSIERWISQDRTPYPRHRHKVARALQTTSGDLWPDAETIPEASTAEPATEDTDLIAAVPEPEGLEVDHRALLATARTRIDLLGLTLAELVDPETVEVLGAKADAGCETRILVSDPDSIHLHAHEAERQPEKQMGDPSTLRWDVERTLGYVQPLLTRSTVQVRMHVASHANSILRVDDQLLATLHLFAGGPGQEPVLHLQDREPAGLFGRFAAHFDLVWQHATATIPHRPDWFPPPDEHPDRYRYPTAPDREIPPPQPTDLNPLSENSPSPDLERQQPRTRRLRKPRR